jgi:hypothetical protein
MEYWAGCVMALTLPPRLPYFQSKLAYPPTTGSRSIDMALPPDWSPCGVLFHPAERKERRPQTAPFDGVECFDERRVFEDSGHHPSTSPEWLQGQ